MPRPGPGPGIPLKAIKWLLMRHGPLVDPPGSRSVDVGCGCSRCCATAPSARYAVNKARMVPIAEYSRDRLRELRADDRHRL